MYCRLFVLPFMLVTSLSLGAFVGENESGKRYCFGLQEEDYMDIYSLEIPVIEVTTEDSVSPTFEVSTSPYVGTTQNGLTNNNYVKGRMLIRVKDSIAYDSGDSIGSMKIKIRGNTSAITPTQKPYKIKLDKKADLLTGEPAGKDKEWVLLCANMMTPFGFKVSELVGMEWVPDYRFVNVVLNGDYRGFYLLVENVKRSEHRCNISKGGFIIEDDAYWWNENAYFHTNLLGEIPMGYTFKYPEVESNEDTFLLKVKDYMNEVEVKMKNKSDDLEDYIDLESFAKWELAHDILGSLDSWGSNVFIYRDSMTDCKLKMGPLWDFDGIYMTSDAWSNIHIGGTFYFPYLNSRSDFSEIYKSEYENVRSQILNVVSIIREEYDDLGDDFNQSRAFNIKKHQVNRRDYEQEISVADEWFTSRIAWMDSAVQTMEVMDVMLIEVAQVAQSDAYWVSLWGVDDSEQTLLQVYDATGRMLRCYTDLEKCEGSDLIGVELNLQPGFYILRAVNGNKSASRKLLHTVGW